MLRTALLALSLLAACQPARAPEPPASHRAELDELELRIERIARRLKRVEASNEKLYDRMEEILRALSKQLSRVRTEAPDESP